jgi:hypothetical protein
LGVFGLLAWLCLWTTHAVALRRLGRHRPHDKARELVRTVVFAYYVGLLVSGLSQESLYPNAPVYNVVLFIVTALAATFGFLTDPSTSAIAVVGTPPVQTAARATAVAARHAPVPLPLRQSDEAAHAQPR